MVEVILALLVILWVLGFVKVPWFKIPHMVLLEFNQHPITLRDFLLFILIIWIVSILPKPLRIVAGLIFVLWVLSIIGVVAVSGLPNLLVLALIIGLFLYVFGFTN